MTVETIKERHMQTKLLFDLSVTQPSSTTKRHGGGIYGEIIFRRIVERKLPVVALYDSSKWFNPEMAKIISNNDIKLLDKQQKGRLDKVITNYGFKKVFCPIENDELFSISGDIDIIGTIHGLRSLETTYDPMMLKYRTCTTKKKFIFIVKKYLPKIGYKHARAYFKQAYESEHFRFAMVSNHSLNALLSYIPQFKGRNIPVFYSPATFPNIVTSRKYNEKYYLMVSANRWEKNCLRAIIAFDRLISSGFLADTKVKITGVKSSTAYKYKLRNSSHFDFMGYVDDNELGQLYHDAYAFIYPSLNEGFGYPPMEAMHYGTPCIVSPFTSIPEICEGAAIYTNPYSIEEIMNRILMMEKPEIHGKYARLSVEQEKRVRAKQDEDLDKMIDFIYKAP